MTSPSPAALRALEQLELLRDALAGLPMTANVPLLQGWLRERLGFEGIVISDYGAVRELIDHGVAGDAAEAAVFGIKAGCDIDMMGYAYVDHLPEAVRRDLVTMEAVDACVRRVLVFKQRLGLFDDPYRRCRAQPPDATVRTERRHFAREVATRSIVLLVDRGGLVPIWPGRQRIAVLGPLANAPGEMRGPWAAAADPREGVACSPVCDAAFPTRRSRMRPASRSSPATRAASPRPSPSPARLTSSCCASARAPS